MADDLNNTHLLTLCIDLIISIKVIMTFLLKTDLKKNARLNGVIFNKCALCQTY